MKPQRDHEAATSNPAPRTCAVCGKALGTRRGQQGLRVHPRCRRSGLDREGLEQALTQTEAALQQLGSRGDEGEIAALFEEATQHARGLVADLRRMRDYMQSTGARSEREARSGRAGKDSAPERQSARERWGTPTTPAWALLDGEAAAPPSAGPPAPRDETSPSEVTEPARPARPRSRKARRRSRGRRRR